MGCHGSLSAVRALFVLLSLSIASAQSVTPTSISFGNQVVSTSSSTKQVTLKNGNSSIAISSISTSLAEFGQTSNCPISPATLAARKSCTVSIVFTPTVLGARSGILTIAEAGNSQTVSLGGTGIAAVSATPTSIAFGNVVVGKRSTAASITIWE